MVTVRDYRVGGYVIWGASNDVATEEGCNQVLDYLHKVIGPAINKMRNTRPSRPPVFNPFAPFNDPEYDVVPVDGSNQANNSIFNYEQDYPPQKDGEDPYNEPGASYNDPQVIIYSAVGPDGAKTIFEYDKGSKKPSSHLNDISPWISQKVPSYPSTSQTSPPQTSSSVGSGGFKLPTFFPRPIFPIIGTTSSNVAPSSPVSSTSSASDSEPDRYPTEYEGRNTVPPRHRRPPHTSLPWLRTYMQGFEETLWKMLTRMARNFR